MPAVPLRVSLLFSLLLSLLFSLLSFFLLSPLSPSSFSFSFLYAANVYTLNNFLLVVNKPSSVLLALRLRLLLLSSFSPLHTPLLLLHLSVLSATLSLLSCGSFFDTLIRLYLICVCVCVCGSFLCAGKTCSHAVHLNFPFPQLLAPAACLLCLPVLLASAASCYSFNLLLPSSSSWSSRAFVVSVN